MQEPQQAEEGEQLVQSLRRKIRDYERWFTQLDGQMRVLERERQKLSAVLNHTDAAFLVVDSTLRVIWVNDVFSRLFGPSSHPGAFLGERCNRILCGSEDTCPVCPAFQPFNTGAVAHHEMRLTLAGQPRHIYATAMPIRSPSAEIEETLVMLQDVSDLEVLRRSQEALKSSEERFRSIFYSAGAGVATVAPDGSFLQVNPAYCRFLGYDEADLLKLSVTDVTHPEDRDETTRFLGGTPGAGAAAKRPAVFDVEKRYVRKDGSVVWGHTTATWLYDAQGVPAYAVGLVQDITERIRAAGDLRRSEARKRAIFETALDCIVSIDHKGTIIEFNPAAERTFGYSRDDVVEKELAEIFIPASMRAAHRASLKLYLETGQATVIGRRIELTATRSDGTEVPVEVAITRVPIDGSPTFTAYMRDLTERKRAEASLRQREEQLQQVQKLEAIGTLAGGVAHDFNNILTGILGHAQLLKSAAQPGDRVFGAAEVIEKAGRRAADLTQQLLGFARKGKHRNIPVDLHATIQETIGLLSRTIDKQIDITQQLRAERSHVLGDPGQIQQVLLNLAVNARDAMPDGGTLSFATDVVELDGQSSRRRNLGPPGKFLLVSVTDSGCGIASELQGRIFEPFFTTKETGKGTGMGLAMVYGIVRNHGGVVEVHSEIGAGSSFRVYLPLGDVAPDERLPCEPGDRRVHGAGTILMVDDEESVRDLARAFLSQLGYRVLTASGGHEAVEEYRRGAEGIDLIIIDMVMPVMGGRECFRALKEINPKVRAILSSGYGFSVTAQEILDEGMLAFVPKPYELTHLSEVVAAALGHVS